MNKNNTAILLLSCKDQKGIVYSVTNFIFNNNGNIINSDQYTDIESNLFFMRIEWDLTGFEIKKNQISERFNSIAKKYNMTFDLKFSDDILDVAVFVSKYDHCLLDILLRNKSGELNANIKLIISNHLDLKSIALQNKIKFYYFPITSKNKKQLEEKELKILQENNIDLIVLARYMQILSPLILNKYKNKMINIHHSFLPAFIGANPYLQAYERGVKIIGATSHYVTRDLDEGPIIAQDICQITHKDTLNDLIRKGRDIEKIVLSKAIRLHLENKILTYNKKTVIFE
jgi:formyltetrahydrofolate deformylase